MSQEGRLGYVAKVVNCRQTYIEGTPNVDAERSTDGELQKLGYWVLWVDKMDGTTLLF
jgi:hypothetical protein